jgi:hypothetical protein
MQTIYLDISNKGVIPCINAKQNEVGRKFLAIVTDGGVPYNIPFDSVVSVWYDGDSGKGNYTDIGEQPAIEVSGNKISVELIEQMLSVPGYGVITILLNSPTGQQIGLWNIGYCVELVAGVNSEKAEEYYNAFSEAAKNLAQAAKMFTVDPTLNNPGQPADAKETGVQISVERKRIDNIIAIGSIEDWENNEGGQPYFFSDEYVDGLIKTNGVSGYISATVEPFTLSAGEEREIELVGIPITHRPISDVALISTNTGFYGTISKRIDQESTEYKFYFVVRNVTESTLDAGITNFSAFFPTEFVYIAELADARIGPDAEKYPTAGDALRNLTKSAVRYDEKQNLSEEQQRQASQNIGAFRNGDKAVTIGEVTAEYKGGQTVGDYDDLTAEVVELSSKNDLDGVVLTGIIETTTTTSAVNKRQLDKTSQNAQNSVIERICPTFEKNGKIVTCEPVEGYPLTVTAEDGATKVFRCGKNLFSTRLELGAWNFATRGKIANDSIARAADLVAVAPNTQYVLSGTATYSWNGNMAFYDKDKKYLGDSKQVYSFTTFTTPADACYLAFHMALSASGVNVNVNGTVQLELGTTKTAYEPYNGGEFTPGDTIPALPGVNILWADSGEIAVKGAEDPLKIIDRTCPPFKKSGKVVTCEPVEGYPLTVTAPNATTITRCGVNVFNYKDWIAYCNKVHPSTVYPSYEEVEYLGKNCFRFSEYRSDASLYYTNIKFKENTRYTFKLSMAFSYLDKESHSGVTVLCVGYGPGDYASIEVPVAYRDEFTEITWTSAANKTIKSLFVADFDATGFIYIPIDKFVIQEGTTAEYAPYLGSTFAPGVPVPALPGVNTLYANSGEIEVKGAEDPVKIINDFQTRLAALEAAVVNNA